MRHAHTKVDVSTPVSQWVLSEKGQEQALALANEPRFQDADVIIVSGEQKSYLTMKPLADKLGKTMKSYDILSELDRDKGGVMKPEAYEAAEKKALTNLEVAYKNEQGTWETAKSALERFSSGIEEINQENEGKKILVCGHGYTINMYFAQLLGKLDKVYERVKKNNFCDFGVIKNGKVVEDICKVE